MDRRRNKYIGGEKGQTRVYQVRKVHDQTLPNHSRETDEPSGIDLMQKGEKVE